MYSLLILQTSLCNCIKLLAIGYEKFALVMILQERQLIVGFIYLESTAKLSEVFAHRVCKVVMNI